MTWSPERKAKQSQAIRQWQPWAKSTGAKTLQGKAIVSRNAFKGGQRACMRQMVRDVTAELEFAQQLIGAIESHNCQGLGNVLLI